MICEYYNNKKCMKLNDVKCSQFRREDKSCYSTLYNIMELETNIICQNCGNKLAQWKSNKSELIVNPKKVVIIIQALTKDTTLKTIQCIECGCFVQVKI